MDAPVAVIRSLAFSAVALGLHACGVVESFEAKPPVLTALEEGPMGAALVCSRRSA
jgi:hypothetical protein